MAKKGGSQVVEKPVFVPPAAAPKAAEAATIQDAVTTQEQQLRKREAAKMGAKSLQIPVSGQGATPTVGTGQ